MTYHSWALSLVIIAVCGALLWLLARRKFAAAVRLDSRLLKPVEKLPRWWRQILLPLSQLLRPRALGAIMIVVALLKAQTSHADDSIFAVLIVAGMALMELLKLMFRRPRPLNEFVKLHKIKSLSFPSGHAGSGLLFFLGIATLAAARPLVSATLVAVGLLIGFSRIYLRVHHPSDVLGGWLIAILWWQLALIAI